MCVCCFGLRTWTVPLSVAGPKFSQIANISYSICLNIVKRKNRIQLIGSLELTQNSLNYIHS